LELKLVQQRYFQPWVDSYTLEDHVLDVVKHGENKLFADNLLDKKEYFELLGEAGYLAVPLRNVVEEAEVQFQTEADGLALELNTFVKSSCLLLVSRSLIEEQLLLKFHTRWLSTFPPAETGIVSAR
jgi:hypothetical protein